MLRHLIDWFKDVAGMWITIGIISVLLIVFTAARQYGFLANRKIALSNQEFNDLSYEKYNGINVTGAEVINAIKRYQEELPVTVYTGESVDTYQGEFTPASNSRSSEKYIKPSLIFTGSILKDDNGDIVSLIFAKEGILLTATSYKELLASLAGISAEDNTMDTIIEQITSQIGEKNSTIEILTSQISDLNNTVSTLQSKNNSLSTQVNTLKSKYTTLSNEVKNGKSLIASAITDKGVETSANASFNTMADNISQIVTSADMKSQVFVFDNSTGIGGSGYSLNFSVTTSEFTPQFIVISSYMYCSSSYGATNIGYITVTSTKYSDGYYTCGGKYNLGTSSSNYIKFYDNQVVVKVLFSILYTGYYYPYKTGTTTVTVYGI